MIQQEINGRSPESRIPAGLFSIPVGAANVLGVARPAWKALPGRLGASRDASRRACRNRGGVTLMRSKDASNV